MMMDTPMLRDEYRKIRTIALAYGGTKSDFDRNVISTVRNRNLPETPHNFVKGAREVLEDVLTADRLSREEPFETDYYGYALYDPRY